MVERYGVVQGQWQCHQIVERLELPYKEVENIFLKMEVVEDLTDFQIIYTFFIFEKCIYISQNVYIFFKMYIYF